MDFKKMTYIGSKLDKFNEYLNMLTNNYKIDFDLFLYRGSNICFNDENCQIISYPNIKDLVRQIKFLNIKNSLDKEFPYLLGDINKKKLFNRVEQNYYQNDFDFVLVLNEDKDNFYIYDSDVAPYIKLSKKRVFNLIDSKIIIKYDRKRILFDTNQIYQDIIKNIFSQNNIGSNVYLKLSKRKFTIKEEISLYFSLKNLTIYIYKLIVFLEKIDLKLSNFYKNELNLLNFIIKSLAKRNFDKKIFIKLYKNRLEMERYIETVTNKTY
jgi:hypothetical protein